MAIDPMEDSTSTPRVLVYGMERICSIQTQTFISSSLAHVEFDHFKSAKRFHEYDGVIVFQSTFERDNSGTDAWGDTYIALTCDRDELVARHAQAKQLLKRGGWICFLVHTSFIERGKYEKYSDTDLCKLFLDHDYLYRRAFSAPRPIDHVGRPEFTSFLDEYGSAVVFFANDNDALNIKTICTREDLLVGFILEAKLYFVPARLPRDHEANDYFEKLAVALISTNKKLLQEIPSWVSEFRFRAESALDEKRKELQDQLNGIQDEQGRWHSFKAILCFDSDALVERVRKVLEDGLKFKVSNEEEGFIQDLTLLDDTGNEMALVEVKGINGNVTNSHIYQSDGHRGRRDKADGFPSILIANTFIKKSNQLSDKFEAIGSEQIKLAVKKNVLVIRTIDLLNLLRLASEGTVTQKEVHSIFLERNGWLEVTGGTWEVKES